MNTNYELFGLKKPTTLQKLEKAKKEVQLSLHPDKHPEEVKEYTEKFKTIGPAYERIKGAIEGGPGPGPAPRAPQAPKVIPKVVQRANPKGKPKEPKTIDEYYIEKNKFPKLFTMTPEGNLITPRGLVFELNPEVPATAEHINKQFTDRKVKIVEAEKDLVTAKKELNEIYIGYKNSINTKSDVINANRNVFDKASILSRISKGDKVTGIIEGLQEKDLHSDNPYGRTKIAEPVLTTFYTAFNWKYFWMDKPQEIEAVDTEEEGEGQEGQEDQEGGSKREKTPEEKARIWAIIRAKKAKAKAASFK
jgi:hypothetical protein